jgi:glycosyltransferase involved in cell wall biosynthesis
VVSIVVPAHNEAGVIGRLLGQILAAGGPEDVDLVVVANGCTDDTASVAASFGPKVQVVSLESGSKRAALDMGDQLAAGFPRLYVDADVELRDGSVLALDAALQRPGVLAAAPRRELDLAGRPVLVRWYYDVWTRLPEVRSGLFGRGVIGVSEAGHKRIASLPNLMADDLVASLAFEPHERVVVPDAVVIVHPPRTVADLVRRRVRAAMTVAQVEQTEGAPTASARTRPGDLVAIVSAAPLMAPRVAFFLVMALIARLRARRAIRNHDYSTWLRDDSSRRS